MALGGWVSFEKSQFCQLRLMLTLCIDCSLLALTRYPFWYIMYLYDVIGAPHNMQKTSAARMEGVLEDRFKAVSSNKNRDFRRLANRHVIKLGFF